MPRMAGRSITRFIILDVRGDGMGGVGARGRVVSFPSGVLLWFGCRCISFCVGWLAMGAAGFIVRTGCVCVCVCVVCMLWEVKIMGAVGRGGVISVVCM